MTETINKEAYSLEVGRDSGTGLPRWLTIRKDGKLHSPPDDRPAKIVFDEQGRPKEMGWFHENSYHRLAGPALQRINPENNVITYEEHRIFGKMHRTGSQPAWIERDPQSGTILEEYYFINDQEVDPKKASKLDLKL